MVFRFVLMLKLKLKRGHMNIESVSKIFQAVRDACDGRTWDHRFFLAADGDSAGTSRDKYRHNLETVRKRLHNPRTAERTQHRLDFLHAAHHSTVVEEISARRRNSTLGCSLLLRAVILHSRTIAIAHDDFAHLTVQNFYTHSLLRSFSTRQIDRELHAGVQCGDFISDRAAHDARKKIYAPSVNSTFDHWADLLTDHVVRGIYMQTALNLRKEWYLAWEVRLGMPTEILDLAYDLMKLEDDDFSVVPFHKNGK